jgi:AICAR transformylase/IMP cyclohydrolase PurH
VVLAGGRARAAGEGLVIRTTRSGEASVGAGEATNRIGWHTGAYQAGSGEHARTAQSLTSGDAFLPFATSSEMTPTRRTGSSMTQ